MKKTLLIESDPHEARAALFEDGRLAELQIERGARRGLVGNIYVATVSRVLPGIQAAFVDIGAERDGYLHVGDVGELPELPAEEDEEAARRIEDMLGPGQRILVQVRRDAAPNKGARVSMQLTLPGRYVVLIPRRHATGVSRRIEDPAERERLLAILEEAREPDEGLIVRTAGEGEEAEILLRDLEILRRRWRAIEERATSARPPALVHQELDLVQRALRDWLDESLEKVVVGDPRSEELARSYLEEQDPGFLSRLRSHAGPSDLFESFGVHRQVDRMLRPRVWLPSGGYLVIHQTEALVAVDVNTGRHVGESEFEETVTGTNLEAAREVARQLRLRDLGGLVVVDFIDMEEQVNRDRVLAVLEEELANDRAKSQVLALSEFGLIEITRKRTRENFEGVLTRPCPCCMGRGRVKTAMTTALEIRREALARRKELSGRAIRVRARRELVQALEAEAAEVLEEVATTLAASLAVEADDGLPHGGFEIVAV